MWGLSLKGNIENYLKKHSDFFFFFRASRRGRGAIGIASKLILLLYIKTQKQLKPGRTRAVFIWEFLQMDFTLFQTQVFIGVLQLLWGSSHIDGGIHHQWPGSGLWHTFPQFIHACWYDGTFLFNNRFIPLSITIGQPEP